MPEKPTYEELEQRIQELEQAESERMQAEAVVRQSEAKFRELIEYSSDWIWEVNAEGFYTYSSPGIEQISGYKPKEIIGKTPFDLMPQEEKTRVKRIFKDAVKKGRSIVALENINIHKNGQRIVLETSGVPFFNTAGEVSGYHGIDRNITERKQVEEELRDVSDKLEMRVRNRTENLSKANEALKKLLDQREIEKRAIEHTMVTNLKRFVFPYLDDLDLQEIKKDSKIYLDIIRTNIEQLIAPLSKNLSGAYLELTPMEIKVADFIRQGKSSKSISSLLGISLSTVEKHRNKIRKKCNLLKKKVNLATYLNSLP